MNMVFFKFSKYKEEGRGKTEIVDELLINMEL